MIIGKFFKSISSGIIVKAESEVRNGMFSGVAVVGDGIRDAGYNTNSWDVKQFRECEDPLAGEIYGSMPFDQLNEIKAKYPLAVDALKGESFSTYLSGGKSIIGSLTNGGHTNIHLLHIGREEAQEEIGEMLAEILNLIAKSELPTKVKSSNG